MFFCWFKRYEPAATPEYRSNVRTSCNTTLRGTHRFALPKIRCLFSGARPETATITETLHADGGNDKLRSCFEFVLKQPQYTLYNVHQNRRFGNGLETITVWMRSGALWMFRQMFREKIFGATFERIG